MRWMVFSLCLGLVGTEGARAAPVPREEQSVRVNGVLERWRLEWRDPPKLACFEDEAVTCPCEGFAQGETGTLELVRTRPDAPPERLPLSPLFAEAGEARPQAMLRGWMPAEGDGELPLGERMRALRKRKRTQAMVFSDYDRDGQAREFVLLTGAYGCGLRDAVLIGVDRRDGRLRALGTAEHPDTPLTLEPETWERLRTSARIESIQTPCGDHGSELEEVVRVSADAQGLHATRDIYGCTADLKRAARQSSEVL